MGDALRRRILQKRFDGPHHEAVLGLMVAASHLRAGMEKAFADEDITPTQYNVLRILNGVYPAGHARGDIARRMIDRAPDLTRLIDRLVSRGLAERHRCPEDARRSMTRISAKGRRLLERLAPHIEAEHQSLVRRLSDSQARTLSRLLERIFDEQD